MNTSSTERYTKDKVEQIVDNLTLFDDDLMSMVFDGNVSAAELLLKIILKREDIEVISVVGQKELENPMIEGRNIRLDVLAHDKEGKHYNIEIQRSREGADERRARFHSSMIDIRMLKSGQQFKDLRESYVIFITEKDYFGAGLPTYTIHRYLEELNEQFQDGSHIIYVNGDYTEDDAIGKLMKDFANKDPDSMNYTELAKGVRHFKKEGGRKSMCEAVKKYGTEMAIQATIEDGIAYGLDKERIITRVCEKYGIEQEDAEMLYEEYAQNLA